MRAIKAIPNYSKRTFTIKVSYPNNEKVTYRTFPVSKKEFQDMEFNTEKDWDNYLNSPWHSMGGYYFVR